MDTYKINKLEIDHFRGYRNKKVFDLTTSPDIVMLSGPNGFGKTSFFDAIEWGFTGKLTRYCEPNEERNSSRFINFQPEERNAKVIIEFGNGIKTYVLCREVVVSQSGKTDYGLEKSVLCIRDNEGHEYERNEAIKLLNELMVAEEWQGKVRFEDIFSQYHLLTQDKLKSFVQGIKATERYKEISILFGTERFLVYNNKFKDFKSYIEKEITKYENEVNRLSDKIKVLQAQNSVVSAINIGKSTDIDEYFNSLIDEFNEAVKTVCMGMEKKLIDESLYEKSKELKTIIINAKGDISKKLFELDQHLKFIQEIELEYINYKDNLNRNKILKELIFNINDLTDYFYIQQNCKDYLNYVSEKNKLLLDIQQYEDRKIISLNNQERLNNIFQAFKIMQFEKELIVRDQDINSSVGLKQTIESIFNTKIESLENEEEIRFIDKNGIKHIILSEYEVVIDDKFEMDGSIKEVLKILTDKIKDELIKAYNELIAVEKQISDCATSMKQVKNEINQLNCYEKESKQILNETLHFLKNDGKHSHDEIGCPVCDAKFSHSDLIKKVEEKIAQDNPIMKDKLLLLDRYEKYYEKLNADVQNIQETKINPYLQSLNDQLDYIKDCIAKLCQCVEIDIADTKQNIIKFNDVLKRLDENNQKVLFLIKKLGIVVEDNNIEKFVSEKISRLLLNVNNLGYDYSNVSIEEIEKTFNTSVTNIKLFENKLVQSKIELSNVDVTINGIKETISKSQKGYNNILVIINTLEPRVIEFENYLLMNNRVKELNILINDLNEKKNIVYNLKNVSSKIDSFIEATKYSIEKINQKIVSESEELINLIFGRIYAHPNFRNLKLCIDFNTHVNNVLYLQCTNVKNNSINPAFTFSSAQVNAVAISIFLALALEQKCTKLENVFFDDPIQDMDDINVLSFIDIMRSILSSNKFCKKFVLSTHDEQFYRLMVKKFRFSNARFFRFDEYSCDGPTFSYYDTIMENKELLLKHEEFIEEIKNDEDN